MVSALAGRERMVMAFSAIFIPTSGAYIIRNTANINTHSEQFFNLVSESNQQVFDATNELNNRLEFAIPPNHKFSGSYKDILNIYKDPKKCGVKIKILGQDWKDLREITKEKDKVSIAVGVHSIGTWRLNDACVKNGINSTLWLEQHRSKMNGTWRYWVLQTSRNREKPEHYYNWWYQK